MPGRLRLMALRPLASRETVFARPQQVRSPRRWSLGPALLEKTALGLLETARPRRLAGNVDLDWCAVSYTARRVVSVRAVLNTEYTSVVGEDNVKI